ncbi:DHA2 family efflux MFS transporter permease subunit [Actinomadura flavalba]|uniref:DHA2 family efflux MFS transporter permease subunit n=1 Tax=Actinomadura flavalba TaxID=1120938 RepID=UPI000374D6CA|nr:DHA2 family efflux MFS transporter permease subunit [Actinomadura flavalba]
MTTTLPAAEAAPARPAGPRPMTVALVLVLGGVMSALDQTVVNVALNRLSAEFGASLGTIQWVVTGYSLALGAVIGVSAWAVGRFGAKRLYLTAVAAFTAGSVLAGLAWNVETLVAFRVVQGLGGGMLMPVGMTILMRVAPPDRFGRLMSTLGLAILVGPLAGPVLGGYLIDELSWRWMFYINLPVGLAVLVLAGRIFPADTDQERRPLDVPGLLMLSPGLALLIFAVTSGGEGGGFLKAHVLVPLLVSVVLLGAFVRRALTAAHPLLNLRLFRQRTFAAGGGTLALFAAGYFGAMILLPLYFQVVRGESATMAGALAVPWALASGLTMQVAGRIVDRVAIGRYLPFAILLALTGFTLFMLQVGEDTPYWRLCLTMVLMGAGGGGTLMPVITATTRNLPRADTAAGSTTVNLINTTVGAVAMAVMAVLLSSLLPVAGGLQELHGLTAAQHAGLAPSLADAFQHAYLMPMALIALSIVPALFLPRTKP